MVRACVCFRQSPRSENVRADPNIALHVVATFLAICRDGPRSAFLRRDLGQPQDVRPVENADDHGQSFHLDRQGYPARFDEGRAQWCGLGRQGLLGPLVRNRVLFLCSNLLIIQLSTFVVWSACIQGRRVCRYAGKNTISSLANMPRLGHLDMRTTPLQDLSPLAHLGQFNTLTNLIILQTQVADLTPLAKLTSVVILFLHNNRISDVSALQSLHPQHLYLQGNSELEDVMPLMSLTNLLSLNLASTRLSVLPAAIGKLTALTYEERQKGDVFVVAVAFMAMCKVG